MLHGRASELHAAERLLAEVRIGRQRTLVVYGEAGIGKTRLVAETVALALPSGFTAMVGAAEPAERGRPFGAISNVLREGLPANGGGDPNRLDELLSELEQAQRDGESWADPMRYTGFAMIDAIAEQLEQTAAASPLLLVLEDLHWADRSSAAVLGAVVRRLAGLPFALILTLRGGEGPGHVDELLDRLAPASTLLTLRELDDDAIAALAGELSGGTAGPTLRRQLASTGGNPFFATELVRALQDEGLLAVSGGIADSTSTSIPRGLMHTVLRRLRLLPPQTRELLQLASILGQSFAVRDLALLAQLTAVQVTMQLAPAITSHTLRESGEQLSFGHALVWEAVYHDLPMGARRAVHRQAASQLAGAGVPAVRVARHFVLGADMGDDEAVSWLRQAARGAAPSSATVAAELLGNALDLAGPEHPDRDSLTAELAPLLVLTGRTEQAAALTEAALARRPDPRVEARLRVGLTHVLIRRGRVDDALEQSEHLVRVLPAPAGDLAAGAASYVRAASGDLEGARLLAERALAAAEPAGNDVVTATALMTLTWVYACSGRIGEAVEAGRRAVALTQASRAPLAGFLFPHLTLGVTLMHADRFDEAERAFTDGLSRAEQTSAPGTVVYYHAGLAAAKLLVGNWDDALSEAEVTLELGPPTGTTWALQPSAIIARVAAARNDLATATTALDDAFALPESRHRQMTADWLHWADAVRHHAAGSLVDAVESAQRCWHLMPSHDLSGGRLLPIDCTRIAVAGGRPELAEEIASHFETVAGPSAPASLQAVALHCRGLITGDAHMLLAAVELLRGSARRYQFAMAGEDAGLALLATQPAQAAAARALFADARAVYLELDARHDLARLAAAMRARGLRVAAPRARARTGAGSGPGGDLTRTEWAVAQLVAQGLSNPQIAQRLFISRYTAETHLKHIFGKLQVSSRAELAAYIAKHAKQADRV